MTIHEIPAIPESLGISSLVSTQVAPLVNKITDNMSKVEAMDKFTALRTELDEIDTERTALQEKLQSLTARKKNTLTALKGYETEDGGAPDWSEAIAAKEQINETRNVLAQFMRTIVLVAEMNHESEGAAEVKTWAEKALSDLSPVKNGSSLADKAARNEDIRAWAKRQPGLTVNDRGRLPAKIEDAYYLVHPTIERI